MNWWGCFDWLAYLSKSFHPPTRKTLCSPGGFCHRRFPKRDCGTRASSSKGENIKAGTAAKSSRSCWITGAAEAEATVNYRWDFKDAKQKLRTKAWKKEIQISYGLPFFRQKIPTKTMPTLRRPFLFSKNDWPAATRWKQLAYLDSVAGHRLVPTELGADVGDSSWKEEFMSFGRFLKDRDLRFFEHHMQFFVLATGFVVMCRSSCLPVVGAPAHLPRHT